MHWIDAGPHSELPAPCTITILAMPDSVAPLTGGARRRQLPPEESAVGPVEAHRGMAETGVLVRPGALDGTGGRDRRHPVEQAVEDEGDLEPGQVGPEAEVVAGAEGQVRVGAPPYVEGERIGEGPLVEVAPPATTARPCHPAGSPPVPFDRVRRRAAVVDGRGRPAEHLLDRARAAAPGPPAGPSHWSGRSIMASRPAVMELRVVSLPAATSRWKNISCSRSLSGPPGPGAVGEPGGGDDRQDVVGRTRALRPERTGAVGGHGGAGRLGPGRGLPRVVVVVVEGGVGPVEEEVPVLLGDAEERRDGLQGQLGGDVHEEVARVARQRVVEERVAPGSGARARADGGRAG